MGFLEDLWEALKDPFSSREELAKGAYDPIAEASAAIGAPKTNYLTGEFIPDSTAKKPTGGTFLLKTALLLGGVAAAPVIYAAYKGQKRGKKKQTDITTDGMFLALEGASNRATSLLAGVLPAFAFPIAYIGVEELEERKIISGPLGDDVQGLMTAGVLAPAVGNVIGSVVNAVIGKGK